MSTSVREDQFRILSTGITHIPTGAKFTPQVGSPLSGIKNDHELGNVLPNGEEYRPEEVQEMMGQLWKKYVADHPDLFVGG